MSQGNWTFYVLVRVSGVFQPMEKVSASLSRTEPEKGTLPLPLQSIGQSSEDLL